MSKPETPIDSTKHNLWNPLVNFATFSGAGYYLGPDVVAKLGDSIVKWIPTPLSPMEFAVGGAFNALAVSGIEYLSGADGNECDMNRVIIVTLTLAATIFIVPHVSNATAKWTGVVLTTEKMMAIAVFNGAVKALTFGLMYFSQYLKSSSIPTIPTSVEEARKLSYFQVSSLHDLLKKDTADWNALSLAVRVVLNKRFAENGNDLLLPFKGFKGNVGTGLEKEEIVFLHEQIRKSPEVFTEEEYLHLNTLFYQQGLSPEGTMVSEKSLPKSIETDLAAYKLTDYATLQKATVLWVALFYSCCKDKAPASTEVEQKLCDRMLELRLASPRLEFATTSAPAKPADLSKVKEEERHLISWSYGYFDKNPSEWQKLSLADRLSWSQAFLKELNVFLAVPPSSDEAKTLTPDQVLLMHQQYHNHGNASPEEWAKLPVEVQLLLNEKFAAEGRSTRTVYPQTRVDVTNMSPVELLAFHQHLTIKKERIAYLKGDALSELATQLSKQGLTLPGVAKPTSSSLLGRVNWTYVGYGTVGVIIVGLAIWQGPALMAALSGLFKGDEPPQSEGKFCIEDKCFEKIELVQSTNVTLPSGEKALLTPAQSFSGTDGNSFILKSGKSLSIDADGRMCVGDADTPCQTIFTLGDSNQPFTVYRDMAPSPSPSNDGPQYTPSSSPTSEGKGNKAGDNQQAINENDLDASGSGQVGSEKGNGGKPTTNLEETQVHHVDESEHDAGANVDKNLQTQGAGEDK